MTSSLRNSIHRRNHKERSQLAHRSKLGILEKHADYVKRARDYHSKQDRLTRLKQKASERNKDEFYFSMIKEKTKGGVHIKDRGNVALPTDIVKVLKTQDENYVRTMRASGLKKIDNLKRQLMEMADLLKPSLRGKGIDNDVEEELDEEELEILTASGIIGARSGKGRSGLRKRKHIVFVDSAEEALAYRGKRKLDTQEEPSGSLTNIHKESDLGWKSDEPKKKKSKKQSSTYADSVDVDGDAEETRKLGVANRTRLLKELSARLARDKQLRYAEREFEMQRQMMGKGARKMIQGVEKVEGDEEEEDEDEIDARKGRRRISVKKVDEETYRPRVCKWRLERKR
ncbi:small-subunit processome [Crucibulum laeve]|uniref:Small-subunit processome n=1 Tax=Crucibulum laeve TaxID=68775 RepID=A0A5C3LVB4_9AGAR|nr:small-subunit processome [Crucibulum laeve]